MSILKEELDALSKYGVLKTEIPEVITANLNPAFPLRDYQKGALFRFIFYITDYQERIRLPTDRYTGSQTHAPDPLAGKMTPLFNPRTQVWSDHFYPRLLTDCL